MTKPKLRGLFDATGFDVPVNPPTTAEVLAHGTAREIREALLCVGISLQNGTPIGAATSAWLGKALQKIGDGARADAALGLTTKRKGSVYHARAVEHMISTAEGVTVAEATEFVARYDPVSNSLIDDPGACAADRLKKRRQRAKTK